MKAARAIDANFNRAQEALRVMEDIARFFLDQASLAWRCKTLRHRLKVPTGPRKNLLLDARDTPGDRTAHLNPGAEMKRADLAESLAANARRAEQALRALEEFSKLPDAEPWLDPADIKSIRFEVYGLEKEMTGALLRSAAKERLQGLYVILDPEVCSSHRLEDLARLALSRGVNILQLRDKSSDARSKLSLARELRAMTQESDALFIVNDSIETALLSEADGVHLGQSDLPVKEARRILPLQALIGVSTHDITEAGQAAEDGADYIGFGCLFPTGTKKNTIPVSLPTLRDVCQAVGLPVAGIGGITAANIQEVYAAGATMAAVIGAFSLAQDPSAALEKLLKPHAWMSS